MYSPLVADNELTVDAEASQEEKQETSGRLLGDTASPLDSSQQYAPLTTEVPVRTGQQVQKPERAHPPDTSSPAAHFATPTMAPALGHYLTEPVATANLVGVRTCSILHDRPAIWLVRRTTMALSPLAAAVLTKEEIIRPKDLKL